MALFFQIQPFKRRVCETTTNQAASGFANPVMAYASLFAAGIPTGQPKLTLSTVFPRGCPRFPLDVRITSPWYNIHSCPLLRFYSLIIFSPISLSQMDPSFLLISILTHFIYLLFYPFFQMLCPLPAPYLTRMWRHCTLRSLTLHCGSDRIGPQRSTHTLPFEQKAKPSQLSTESGALTSGLTINVILLSLLTTVVVRGRQLGWGYQLLPTGDFILPISSHFQCIN